jgi:hypothetical protein
MKRAGKSPEEASSEGRAEARDASETPTGDPVREGHRSPLSPASASPVARRDATANDHDVAAFLARMRAVAPHAHGQRGRLIFAMDATMSRRPTWDMAMGLQTEMFRAVEDVGGLDVQLVFFRGAGECRASRWVSDPQTLARLMTGVDCRGGYTQIGKVLTHARREAETARVHALVYVGDCMEEGADDVCGRAGELALLGVPVFLFQEGRDATAEVVFREIARLTKGAWCRFDSGSATQLRELLSAVAVYAAGGRRALTALADRSRSRGAQALLQRLDEPGAG